MCRISSAKSGTFFKSRELLKQALTHRSFGTSHNERLEFLGDSVLNCIIAQAFVRAFSGVYVKATCRGFAPTSCGRRRWRRLPRDWVWASNCAWVKGELKSGGFRRPSILADGLEALFGAVFLDGGFERARQTILRLYGPYLSGLDPHHSGKDAKTTLQEFLQGRRLALPQYQLRATRWRGPRAGIRSRVSHTRARHYYNRPRLRAAVRLNRKPRDRLSSRQA
jgi:ribonuclease-3